MIENTRDIAAQRKLILLNWFEELKENGKWQKFVNNKGKLKPTSARRKLHEIETGQSNGSWNNNYFKSDHWSQILREEVFERWVQGELAKATSHNNTFNFDHIDKGNLNHIVEKYDLPEEVINHLIKQEERIKSDNKNICNLQRKLEKRERKILELDTMLRNIDRRHASINAHYTDSIRTLKYNAGMDVDLSREDLPE